MAKRDKFLLKKPKKPKHKLNVYEIAFEEGGKIVEAVVTAHYYGFGADASIAYFYRYDKNENSSIIACFKNWTRFQLIGPCQETRDKPTVPEVKGGPTALGELYPQQPSHGQSTYSQSFGRDNEEHRPYD